MSLGAGERRGPEYGVAAVLIYFFILGEGRGMDVAGEEITNLLACGSSCLHIVCGPLIGAAYG